MFNSLYFKDEVDKAANACVDDRYEGSQVNDKSLGKMYYLKCLSKAADVLYNQLRDKIDTSGTKNDKTVIARDKFFSVTSQVRAGSSKIDRDLMYAQLSSMLEDLRDEQGNPVYSKLQVQHKATEIITKCTVYGKDSIVVSVMENGDV